MAKTCINGCDRPVFSKKMCRYCWGKEHAKPIARREIEQKPRKKIKPVADKRVLRNAEYAAIRAVWLPKHEFCQARIAGCQIMVTDIHHKKGKIGDLLIDTAFFLAVCRSCHDWIEDHPKLSYEMGFSLLRNGNNIL